MRPPPGPGRKIQFFKTSRRVSIQATKQSVSGQERAEVNVFITALFRTILIDLSDRKTICIVMSNT